jgi:hypothetical protein
MMIKMWVIPISHLKIRSLCNPGCQLTSYYRMFRILLNYLSE